MSNMAETPILRFPISGQEHGYFLLEVAPNGSRPLDLKLIGSESTAVFVVKLRHKKIDEYKAVPSHCTDEEWEQALISIFVDLKPVPGIEVRADIQSDSTSVILSFRKNIQGITQRLGSLTLEENDKTEISPFDWCVSAIASRTKVIDELVTATAKIESLEQCIEELKAQLDDFIVTKEEDETQMLEKFRDLLNEKKLKIRQQHRLLAAAKVDPEKLANMGGGDGQDAHHDAGPSRWNKRKAVVKEEDESDDGFEEMDIDRPNGGDSASTNNQLSSDPDADENQQLGTDNGTTASEPDTEDEPPIVAEVERKGASAPGRVTKPKTSASKLAAQPRRGTRASASKPPAPRNETEEEEDAPPPPRILPFARAKKVAPPKPVDDDETPSDEDDDDDSEL